MTLLSPNFTLEEFTASQWAARHGVDNSPPASIMTRLIATAESLEDVRRRLGNLPILISSGYRNTRVNSAIGGVTFPPSAHMLGYAVDFTCPRFGPPFEIARFLANQADLSFDQLIYEYRSWVHISFDPTARRQCLSIRARAEGYLAGIIDLPEAA